MSKPRETRLGCYAVIHDEEKLLLCRLCDGLAHHGKWTLPGGGLEFGETIEEAMVREVEEETGLHVIAKSLLSHHSRISEFDDKSMHIFQFLLDVEIKGGTLRNETGGSTDLVEWVPLSTITQDNAVDIVHYALAHLR